MKGNLLLLFSLPCRGERLRKTLRYHRRQRSRKKGTACDRRQPGVQRKGEEVSERGEDTRSRSVGQRRGGREDVSQSSPPKKRRCKKVVRIPYRSSQRGMLYSRAGKTGKDKKKGGMLFVCHFEKEGGKKRSVPLRPLWRRRQNERRTSVFNLDNSSMTGKRRRQLGKDYHDSTREEKENPPRAREEE